MFRGTFAPIGYYWVGTCGAFGAAVGSLDWGLVVGFMGALAGASWLALNRAGMQRVVDDALADPPEQPQQQTLPWE